MNSSENRRVLFMRHAEHHEDFRKILCPAAAVTWTLKRRCFFGAEKAVAALSFQMDLAYQGAEALEKVQASLGNGLPYAMAFLDMRMPPGWDGVETVERLWQADPRLQIVFCTAFSDYSWKEILSGSR